MTQTAAQKMAEPRFETELERELFEALTKAGAALADEGTTIAEWSDALAACRAALAKAHEDTNA